MESPLDVRTLLYQMAEVPFLVTLEMVVLIGFLLMEASIAKFLWEWLLLQFLQVLAVHNVCLIFTESSASLVDRLFSYYACLQTWIFIS